MKLSHRQTADTVIADIGRENLIYTSNAFWQWVVDENGNPKGLWEIIDDRAIKQLILKHTGELTAGTVSSILDHIKTKQFKSEFLFNPESNTINCLNGEIRVSETGVTLEPHMRENYRTSQIPVAYAPDAECPQFSRFLNDIFREDEDSEQKKTSLLEMMGYSLTSTAILQKAMILVGSGANGKSVLLSVLEALCGRKNCAAVQPRDFENTFKIAHLHGKLANIVTEFQEGSSIAEDVFKAIISGDPLSCSHKYSKEFEFNPYCTLWFSTNHLPHIRDFSDAVFRRAIIIQFNEKFEGRSADPFLVKKLIKELPGILNLCLVAYQALVERGGEFTEAPSSKRTKAEWRVNSDQLMQFIEDKIDYITPEETPDQYFMSGSDLYDLYKQWYEESGGSVRYRIGRNQLIERFKKLAKFDRKNSIRGFKGIMARSSF